MTGTPLNIVAFCCEHCAYAAADLAGGLRMQYPPDVRIVQLPCTGRLDVLTVLQAFDEGVDGVMAAGCLPGNCHFLEGNLNARRRVTRIQGLLGEIGLEPGRVEMFNMSAAMAAEFVTAVTEMTERINEMGPSPLRVGGAGRGGD
ncbi:MAG: hydrogenase iron-sulfur subunit [Actinobacteria bacterium]|nr:hydrogenase iron-sulfur subunit [Actinomycetota bacterium]